MLAPERGASSVALDGDAVARKTMIEVRASLDAAIEATRTLAAATDLPEAGAVARDVQQAAAGTSEVSQSIGRVLDATRQTQAAAGQLSGLTDQLSRQSDRLRHEVGGFVAEVKVA